MKTSKTKKESVFSVIFPSSEPAQDHTPSPQAPRPAFTGEQIEALTRKIEMVERNLAAQVEKKNSEPLPPSAILPDTLAPRLAALEDMAKKLEECSAAAAKDYGAMVQATQLRAVEFENRLSGEVAGWTSRVASLEEGLRHLDPTVLNSLSMSIRLMEGRIKSLESGGGDEFYERFSSLSVSAGEAVRKAGLAMETAVGGVRRLDRLEEMLARLPYIESRFAALESKVERVYELDALAQSLKLSVEGMEEKFSLVMKEAAVIAGGQNKMCSDFDSLSSQVRQMSALFNQFRAELSFLIPKKQRDTGWALKS